VTVYVGTYAGPTSRGIYRFTLDTDTGAPGAPVLVAETINPSFLALHPNGRVLYAVNEVDEVGGVAGGRVSAFAIDARSGQLTLLNQQPSEGAAPCHLVVDRDGRYVLVANYNGGNVAVLPILADGRLGAATHVTRHAGSGPNAARQQQPHAHGVHFDPTQRIVVAPDLGADRLFVHRYDPDAGTLTEVGAGRAAPGAGPRHAAFGAGGRVLYAINELTSTISVFDVDAAAGRLTHAQDVTTLPAQATVANTTAELVVSPMGGFRRFEPWTRQHRGVRHRWGDRAAHTARARGGGRKTPRHFAIPRAAGCCRAPGRRLDRVSARYADRPPGRDGTASRRPPRLPPASALTRREP
jgi:6-phosphogluconolactonase